MATKLYTCVMDVTGLRLSKSTTYAERLWWLSFVFPAKQQQHLETHTDYLLNPHLCTMHNYHQTAFYTHVTWQSISINPYPTAYLYGNGMVLHFYQQQESSTTKTVHKVINKGLKTYVQSLYTGENFH